MEKFPTIQYYKVVEERQSYLGDKYFMLSYDSDTVWQICFIPGPDVRRGRTNAVGFYTITRQSLATNYMAMNYVKPISKKEYMIAYKKMMKILSTLIN